MVRRLRERLLARLSIISATPVADLFMAVRNGWTNPSEVSTKSKSISVEYAPVAAFPETRELNHEDVPLTANAVAINLSLEFGGWRMVSASGRFI